MAFTSNAWMAYWSCAVTKITGGMFSAPIARSTPKPSISGICTSSITRSGRRAPIMRDGLGAVARFGDRADRRLLRQQQLQALARQRLVVDDQYVHFVSRKGSTRVTTAPPSACDSVRSSASAPYSCLRRARVLASPRPIPPPGARRAEAGSIVAHAHVQLIAR